MSLSSKKCSTIQRSQNPEQLPKDLFGIKTRIRGYEAIIGQFIDECGDGPADQVSPEQILTFLIRLTKGNKSYISKTQR
jgi:hypothetical protein